MWARVIILMLLLGMTPGRCYAPTIPTDVYRIRTFAIKFNRYYSKLLNGNIAIEDWKKVTEDFEDLTNCKLVPR